MVLKPPPETGILNAQTLRREALPMRQNAYDKLPAEVDTRMESFSGVQFRPETLRQPARDGAGHVVTEPVYPSNRAE